jgi:hypothetical protein
MEISTGMINLQERLFFEKWSSFLKDFKNLDTLMKSLLPEE